MWEPRRWTELPLAQSVTQDFNLRSAVTIGFFPGSRKGVSRALPLVEAIRLNGSKIDPEHWLCRFDEPRAETNVFQSLAGETIDPDLSKEGESFLRWIPSLLEGNLWI